MKRGRLGIAVLYREREREKISERERQKEQAGWVKR